MSSEFDREIDSLLREGARRSRGAFVEGRADSGVRAVPSGAHLDADELNAYAENALPPSARTHHAAHLADCDDCRRSATALALAAGMPAQLEQREAVTTAAGAAAARQKVSPDAGWRERLGALLAPRAWRYAVPALALLLVGAVALVVFMRGRRDEPSLARHNTTERAKPTVTQSEQHHAAQQNDNTAAATAPTNESVASAPNSNATATMAREETAPLVVDGASEGQAPPGSGVVVNEDAVPVQPPPAPATGSGAVARAITEMPVPTPTPVPPMPVGEPIIVTPEREGKSVGQVATDAQQQRQADYASLQREQAANARRAEKLSGPRRNSNEQMRNSRAANMEDARNRADNADKNDENVAATTAAPSAAANRARQRDAERERDGAKPSDDSLKSESRRAPESVAGETRSVGGRRFRKQGGAWVDTAYSAGQSYTVVRRNSEQYRALVADEPAIGRISNALGGEVTVVWKGRAYRIR
ncbi:MAG TPA: hypothetical protein VK363_18580 [Pyrinomonadaceae bacterium]|nr:hypothetical protein [Pyrinomonadaceae bacterium]